MDNALVARLNQAAIDGIRGAGATSQTIFVEGNSWSGAWTWVSIPPQDNATTRLTNPPGLLRHGPVPPLPLGPLQQHRLRTSPVSRLGRVGHVRGVRVDDHRPGAAAGGDGVAQGQRQEGRAGRDGRRRQRAVHQRADGHARLHGEQFGCVDGVVVVGGWSVVGDLYVLDVGVASFHFLSSFSLLLVNSALLTHGRFQGAAERSWVRKGAAELGPVYLTLLLLSHTLSVSKGGGLLNAFGSTSSLSRRREERGGSGGCSEMPSSYIVHVQRIVPIKPHRFPPPCSCS